MKPVKNIAIVGAGTMGCGIAEVASLCGYQTTLVQATNARSNVQIRGRIVASMDKRVERGKLSAVDRDAALDRLAVVDDHDAVNDSDLVIESVIEDLEVKRKLFEELAQKTPAETILATNTSTLKLSDLLPASRRENTVGLHFFSPVPAMNLVEVARTTDTRPDVFAEATRFVESLHKTPIPVVDSTGFIVNRLLVPLLLGAIVALEEGLASSAEIDRAMQLGCGHPMGPLALCDFIGLDVVFHMSRILYKEFGDSRYRPPALLRRLVQDGHLGKKTGQGFFEYPPTPKRMPNAA